MYDTFYTERIYSNPMHGYIFVAQLLSGEVTFGARLATPIGEYQNDFYLGAYEWDKKPYVLDVGPLYKTAFDTPEVKKWIEDVVKPWAREQKLAYIDRAIKYNEEQHERLVAESLRLQDPAYKG